MPEALAETLANDVGSGEQPSNLLEACDAILPIEYSPNVVRFSQFTLFSETRPRGFGPPRLLVLQPQRLVEASNMLEESFRKALVKPIVARWEAELPTRSLPDAASGKLEEIREAIRSMRDRSGRTGGELRHGIVIGPAERAASLELSGLPLADAPESELRAAYQDWLRDARDRALRGRLRSFAAILGVSADRVRPGQSLAVDEVTDLIIEMIFPGPFQPFEQLHPLVALCSIYEQTWQLQGYTRGELLSSLTLAPGERATLEVHSWDKSSRKTEDELATESEIRTSEKLTQRDALTVAQEYARQRSSNVNANATIPIPKMPIGVSGSVSTQTNESLRKTRESVRDQTVEASNTLKVNRKTRVEVSRESGREERQTRVIENTNRCHSLNCHYFEVMANYRVQTRLASVKPCVLLPTPRPAITVEWVLCHEGILIAALRDRVFLPGFEAAKTLKTQTIIKELEAQALLEQTEELGEQLGPAASAMASAYALLTAARNTVKTAIEHCGNDPLDIFCILDHASETDLYRTVVVLSLPDMAVAALERVAADVTAGRHPAEVLRTFFTVASPGMLAQPVSPDTLGQRLLALGVPSDLATALLKKDPLALDDGGVRAAVAAAAAAMAAHPAEPVESQEDRRAALLELAQARMEFERLQCHLKENWLHYVQAVAMREDHGQRFMRLQNQFGTIVTLIENELLGFYGDRAAYPLRDPGAITTIDLEAILAEASNVIEEEPEPPVRITLPTSGVILEAMIGQCDACEDYIRESRVIDLRSQDARARQQEAEAERREQRLAANPPDLSDPASPAAGPITVRLEKPAS